MKTLAFVLNLIFFALLPSVAAAGKPNVIFIVCDDLNTHVTTSGYKHIQTPTFEKLAASGMSFGRAYCQYPVCGPSRASFLSGLYPESTGVIDNFSDIRQTRPGTVSLPQAFKESGYWTASTGKIFHNGKADHGELAWNEVVRFENDEMPIEAAARKKWEAEHGPITRPRNRKAWREFLPTVAKQTRNQAPGWGPSGLTDAQHRDGKNARQAAEWIDQKSDGEKPFFIAVGIHKPHVPFLAPDKYFDLYPLDKLQYEPAPPDFWKQAPRTAMCGRYKSMGFELGAENDPLRRELMQAYHACITFIDAQIGMIFDSLKKNGQWDNTIIVLTSDHGFQLGEHFMWGKDTLFEVCNRVPLIIRVPGVTTDGSSSDGLVELVDLYPTLTDLCGISAPDDLQGKSLVPMLKDPSAVGKERVYTVVSRGKELGKALRSDRWRYSRWQDGEELYDLKNDIKEHHNLANSPESKAILVKMRRDLAEIEKSAASKKVGSANSVR
ncbi:sulfatase [Haloferula sp.]|uniref:sulfatase n=1 Tax=Haloferula sp. TaxID=2497595 RepID=UPI003C761F62